MSYQNSDDVRAIVYLADNQEAILRLKQLALFFDEVIYIPPESRVIKEEVLKDPERFRKLPNGSLRPLGSLNILIDTVRGLSRLSFNKELEEALAVFEENGIVRQWSNTALEQADREELEQIRDLLVSLDIRDEEFNKLSGTEPKDFRGKARELGIRLDREPHEELTFHVVDEPNCVGDSYEITTSLWLSHVTSSFPVFINPRHRLEVEYRYRQYKDGLRVLQGYPTGTASPAHFRAHFGEVTFSVVNSLVSSDLLLRKSAEDIVKYRNSMNDAREQYLSGDLMELASLIEDNPWNAQSKTEIEKYIMGKLRQDLVKYDIKSRETWEKLFGSITIHLAEVSKYSVVGGGAGGILGNLIPNTTTLEMLLLGALAGTATQAPKIAKDLVDAVTEVRSNKRNSIAYIANFT